MKLRKFQIKSKRKNSMEPLSCAAIFPTSKFSFTSKLLH